MPGPSIRCPQQLLWSPMALLMTLGPSRARGFRFTVFCAWDLVREWKPSEAKLEAVGGHVFFHMESVTLEGERRRAKAERNRDGGGRKKKWGERCGGRERMRDAGGPDTFLCFSSCRHPGSF